MMKYFFTLLLIVSFTIYVKADYWTQKSNFGGTARHAAAGFFVEGKAYIGTGGTFSLQKKDFWQWDPATNVWSQKADFGGTARSGAVGFAIGSLGYIATGFSNTLCKDMYAYNPATNSWTQKADFGGSARHFAVGFELDGMGYIGTGDGSGAFKDFWQYNPVTNTWTQKANFGGVARSSAAGFGLDGKGYLGIGYGTSSQVNDFWQYDPAGNSWTQKANFGGGARSDGIAFSLCDKGYIAAGVSSASIDKNDLWEYDPTLNNWIQKASFSAMGREDGVGFSDGTNGYIGTGTNIFNEFGDFFQYTSDCLILPIGLSSLTAVQKSHSVIISWTTASEVNNKFFTVEKSLDAVNFETLSEVAGSGNSASDVNYQAEDQHPFSGLNYYRLKQTDFNGAYSYSSVVSCRVSGIGMMRVLSVNPVPVQSILDITTDLSDDDELQINFFTTNGQLVWSQSIFVKQDIQRTTINVGNLQEGIYLLRISCEYGSFSQKVIKIN